MEIMQYIQNSLNLYFGKLNKGYKYIDKEVNWKQAYLIVVSLTIISGIIGILINFTNTFGENPTNLEIIGAFIGMIIGVFLGILLGMVISYGILHLLLRAFGGTAKFEETIKYGLSISIFPIIVGIIVRFIPESLVNINNNPTTPNIIIFTTLALITLIIILWNFIVSINVYSKLHKIDKIKTAFAMILPLLIVGILLGLLIIYIKLLVA